MFSKAVGTVVAVAGAAQAAPVAAWPACACVAASSVAGTAQFAAAACRVGLEGTAARAPSSRPSSRLALAAIL